MIDYMDYIIKAFDISTNWQNCNSGSNHLNYIGGNGCNVMGFENNITCTSDNLLNFHIPSAFKFQLSNRSTPYTYNTIDISTKKIINGSLTYIYTDAENLDKIVKDTKNVNLLDVVETYKLYNRKYIHRYYSKYQGKTKSLYYGRMYYPSSFLEAMIIKKFTPSTQFIMQWISSANNYNIVTCYLQRSRNRTFQELVLSSNDLLCGYRFLHHFVESPSKFNNSLYNNSQLSIGTEFWLNVSNLSPTCSSTLRYCTHSTSTGRPLVLTISINPIFGHFSSTYSAKTTTSSTFCVKYDFNIYSMESNLSLGCELWRNNPNLVKSSEPEEQHIQEPTHIPKHLRKSNHTRTLPIAKGLDGTYNDKRNKVLNDLNTTFSSSLQKIDNERSLIENFHNGMYDKNFSSVWKFSTSLRDENLRILWNGKYKGFILVAGTELLKYDNKDDLNLDSSKTSGNFTVFPAKLGFQIQYAT